MFSVLLKDLHVPDYTRFERKPSEFYDKLAKDLQSLHFNNNNNRSASSPMADNQNQMNE